MCKLEIFKEELNVLGNREQKENPNWNILFKTLRYVQSCAPHWNINTMQARIMRTFILGSISSAYLNMEAI